MRLVTAVVRNRRTSCLLLFTITGISLWLSLYRAQMYILRSFRPMAFTVTKTSSSNSDYNTTIPISTTSIPTTTTAIPTTSTTSTIPTASPTASPTLTPTTTLTLQYNSSPPEESNQLPVVPELPAEVVLCVEDKPYGQTFNMVLTIAAARSVVYEWSNNNSNHNNSDDDDDNDDDKNTTSTRYKVGFGPYFSDFIVATLEPPDDILLHYYDRLPNDSTNDECHLQMNAMDLFYNFFQMDWNVDSRIQLLQSLIPRRMIREQARSYLQEQQRQHRDHVATKKSKKNTNTGASSTSSTAILTTVHRRHFEKSCHIRSQNRDKVHCLDLRTGNRKNTTESLSDQELSDLCHLNYTMIQKDLKINRGNSKNYIVLLCTDRQVPKYDRTFPHLVNIAPERLQQDDNDPRSNSMNSTQNKHANAIIMMIEAWMMTLSDIHYGIPMSTVDLVVHVWRNSPLLYTLEEANAPPLQSPPPRREMRPLGCYGS